MAEIIRMPKLSDTMECGTVLKWHKKQGDLVKAGDLLAEIETDKATMDLEAYEDGTLLHIGATEKESVPIHSVLAITGEPGEDITHLVAAAAHIAPPENNSTASPPDAPPIQTPQPDSVPLQDAPCTRPLAASPLARKMALDYGYDLKDIQGSGEGGRIIKRDVEKKRAVVQAVGASIDGAPEGYREVEVSAMRKTIAERLVESKRNAPHFYLTVDLDMENAWHIRERLNAYSSERISFNDLIVKAVALSMRKHPGVNAAWQGNTIRYFNHIHVGVAVSVEQGLVVPVIKFAETKTLSQIASETKALRQKAQSKGLTVQESSGATFTISNLGMLGVDFFTAIINPPAVCILAVGAIRQVPVVRSGAIVARRIMRVTLSCDHRAVDGAVGAAFINDVRELLEDPTKMLV